MVQDLLLNFESIPDAKWFFIHFVPSSFHSIPFFSIYVFSFPILTIFFFVNHISPSSAFYVKVCH